MVVIRKQRTSRLSTMIDAPGGVSVATARAQAAANLDVIKPRGLEIISALIAELAGLPAPTGPDTAAVDRAYGLSAGVVDAAGPFEMNDLCRAASGLCDLLDAAVEGQTFDWRIVTVHVQAMQLMLSLPSGPAGDAARSQVLDGLDDVLRAKLQPSG
jgi:hypothetical protein